MCDWDWMIDGLAKEKPLFETDTTNCYHGLNWGWILAEVVVRTDPKRRPFGQWVQEEICHPLDIDSLFIGIPPEVTPRVATLFGPPGFADDFFSMPEPASPCAAIHNQQIVRESCHPGAGGICNARSMARFWAMLANGGELGGVHLLQENTLRNGLALRKNPLDVDLMIRMVALVGRGGWWVGGAGNRLVGESPNILYNPGAGGSIAFADLDRKLAVAITHNNMGANPEGFIGVADAVRAVVSDLGQKAAA
jgi:CubicO group peptidase (beta-lactamase class C family)